MFSRVQVAGLTCDWLLLMVWSRLYYLAGPKERAYLKFGVAGAFMHMAEILPLVSLLVGLVPAPWLPGQALNGLLPVADHVSCHALQAVVHADCAHCWMHKAELVRCLFFSTMGMTC